MSSNNPLENDKHPGSDGQIVTIMKEVHSALIEVKLLNERNINNDRRLVESENRTSEALANVAEAIEKVHDRLDVVRDETDSKIATALKPISDRQETITSDVSSLQKKFEEWLNRGKGAWWAASICMIFIQGVIVYSLIWTANEIKTLHDWRISIDAINRTEEKRTR